MSRYTKRIGSLILGGSKHETALTVAKENGHFDIVALLKRAGAK